MFFKNKKPVAKTPQNKMNPHLIATLNNELTEPLSALNGLHDLMLKTELTKEQKHYLAAMIDSTFKLEQAIQTLSQLGEAHASQTAQAPENTTGCNVLVIEQEILSARIFIKTLTQNDITHRRVHNLPEAIITLEESLATAQPFTHILVDDALHSVTPQESVAYIKAALQHTTHCPQIILTSRQLHSPEHEKALQHGYDSMLTKPLRAAALLAYLGRSVNTQKLQQA